MLFSFLLQSLELVMIGEKAQSVETGIHKLNAFLQPLAQGAGLVEWGCPHGSFGRLIPAILTRSFPKKCLWIYDKKDLFIYPNSWKDLGFDLTALHFICAEKPLKELRPAFSQDCYKFIILDSSEFIKAAELRFLLKCSEEFQSSIFLLRPFFLSNKNGNPFFKFRINSSFELRKNAFQLNFIKGAQNENLSLQADEVFL